jgi:quercetin 2,3-dioxygenase
LLNGTEHLRGEALIAPLSEEGDTVTLEAKAETQLLILTGEPIREPVASYGPFVMNTREELQQAVEDYRAGRMGHLS